MNGESGVIAHKVIHAIQEEQEQHQRVIPNQKSELVYEQQSNIRMKLMQVQQEIQYKKDIWSKT